MSGWEAALLQVVAVVVPGALAVLLGGPVVQAVFRRVDRSAHRAVGAGRSAGDQGQDGVVAAAQQLPGGAWIGRLERLAIFSGLVARYPEAIAICLALKGLARYPELKATTAGAAERFIIGTFVSVLVACGAAGVGTWLVRLVQGLV
ncbi:hypothetical protein GCM10027030_20700 [Luteococcus sediminum]